MSLPTKGTNLFVPGFNPSPALTDLVGYVLVEQTGTLDTTAGIYQHGSVMVKTDTATGANALFENIGSTAAPQWASLLTSATAIISPTSPNFIASETGTNNAIAGSLSDVAGNVVALATGLAVGVVLAHTLQAGANTFAFNSAGTKNIKSHFNKANNIATAYAVGSIVGLIYDGVEWQDQAQ